MTRREPFGDITRYGGVRVLSPSGRRSAFRRSRIPVASPGISAPTGPFTAGTQVGVPTGTTLTTRASLGAATGTETITITHPITGVSADLSASVWRGIQFTSTVNPTVPAGQTYWLDQCELNVSLDFFCVDVIDTNGSYDLMLPLMVFTDCTFTGNDLTGKCVNGGFLWLIRCDLGHTEDGFGGLYYSVVQDSNIVCTTDGQADPHSDGIQCAGIGESVVYHCWLDAGRDGASANAPLRLGTEFSAVTNVDIRYCGLAGVAHGLQVRGDAGAGDISNITVIGNRWVDEQLYGPTDFAETTAVTWSDNAFMDGTAIPNPVP